MMKTVQATALALVLAALGAMVAAPPCTAMPALQPAQPSAASAEAPSGPAATGLGRLSDPVEMRLGTASGTRLAQRATALPAQYDLRAEGRLSPVKDQRQYGTCWAFANIGALESRLLSAEPAEPSDFSEANLVTRSGFGPFLDQDGHTIGRYWAGGYDAMAVAYFARWAGPVNERDDPYPSKVPPRTNVTRKRVQDVVMLPGRASVYDNDLLKQMVIDYGALSVGMYWGDGSYKGDTSAYYRAGRKAYENHGVCIVGWDDAYSKSNFAVSPPGDGAFIVRNSWGSAWGDSGYFYASYYNRDFAFGDCTSYARVDDLDLGIYQREYQYDKLGLVQARAFSGAKDPSTASIANRYTARANERLVAVGFYATAGDCTYRVYAGPSLRSLTRYTSGTLALPGYHTVDLPSAMSLQRNHRFVVAVRLTTPGAKPMPLEKPLRGYSTKASASPGQSFIRPGSARWWDLTGYQGLSEANVCLKAYTAK